MEKKINNEVKKDESNPTTVSCEEYDALIREYTNLQVKYKNLVELYNTLSNLYINSGTK